MCVLPQIWESAVFLEPSAGVGDIYAILPHGRRIGVELDEKLVADAHTQHGFTFIHADFLTTDSTSLGLDQVRSM